MSGFSESCDKCESSQRVERVARGVKELKELKEMSEWREVSELLRGARASQKALSAKQKCVSNKQNEFARHEFGCIVVSHVYIC